jgi:hypothetical protein
MVVVMRGVRVMVVMTGGGKRGTCTRGKEHSDQNKLLHGATVARWQVDKQATGAKPDQGRKRKHLLRRIAHPGVDWRHDTPGRFPRTEP